MAQSGVSYTWGRESTSAYGESLAGVFVNSGQYPCDPYVILGNPASGLLPLIQTNSPGTPGHGDQRVQCYNFRLCLTQNPTNQIPITAPANYSESTYELLHRYINAYVAANGSVPLNRLIDVQTEIPNGKTDINAYADVSTDFIGYNYTYPTNNYVDRQAVYQAHKDYISGLLYYLSNSTNVPVNVRTNMQSFGYAKDEFQDHGGWPYLMYIREARRMVSGYVMQQQDAQGLRAAPDSISLANYTLDCHPAARLAINGVATWEGGIGTAVPKPYPVSYRSIVPSVGQCQNLFCTFALSASHVGFASIRLEPVFMMTSHAAGDAAAFAIDDNVPVQSVNYSKLAAQLTADGQILSWGSVQPISTNGIILNVTNASGITKSRGWSSGSNQGGWPLPGGPYLYDSTTSSGQYVRFTPNLATNGYYDVYVWWVFSNNRATNVPVVIVSASTTNVVTVNQQINCTNWIKVASSNYFDIGTAGSVTITNGGVIGLISGYAIANAVRFMPLGNIAPNSQDSVPVVEVVASDALTGEFGTNAARFSVICPNGANAFPLTVNYSVGGTATPGVDYVALPGSVTLAAGAVATNIYVRPLGDNLNTNQETLILSLAVLANYSLTGLSNATVNILDRPIHNWLRANFSPVQLADPTISGDAADPADDGLPNLLKYALGLNPNVPEPNPFMPVASNGLFTVTYPLSSSAPDVALSVLWSTNLVAWVPGTSVLQQINIGYSLTNEVITIGTAGNLPAGYVRFNANRR
jgi:hypothetical protein